MEHWVEKAIIYVTAYEKLFGVAPSRHNVLFGLSVAQLESQCGDASVIGNNWGATVGRQLTPEERAKLHAAGLDPTNAEDIPKAQALLGPQPNLILYRDFDPRAGTYWIYFFDAATQVDAAAYFIKVLVGHRSGCRMIMDDPQGTLDQLAREMYATHYFSGVHAPTATVIYDGKQMSGMEANIEEYRDGLMSREVYIAEAIAGWVPSTTPPIDPLEPPFDLYAAVGYQAALAWLASKLHRLEFNPGIVDGKPGPKTKKAVEAFQSYMSIQDDGDVGEQTRAAILKAVEMISTTQNA